MEKVIEQLIKPDMLDKLEAAGLNKVVSRIKSVRLLHQKLDIAYKNYQLIATDEIISEFNEKLKKETLKEDKYSYSYKHLLFTPLEEYQKVPPDFVLERIIKAKQLECFDSFEVCTIGWHKEIKDPIVFGIIKGCSDKFFISQWDDDITITELLEGKPTGE